MKKRGIVKKYARKRGISFFSTLKGGGYLIFVIEEARRSNQDILKHFYFITLYMLCWTFVGILLIHW